MTHDLVVVSMDNGALTALWTSNGTPAWSLPIDGLAAPVSLAADDTTVYLTMEGSRVAAVASASGQLIWQVTLEGTLESTSRGERSRLCRLDQ